MARSKENTHSEPARLEQVIEIVGMSFTDLEMTFDDLMYSGAMLTKDNVFRVGLMQALHEVAIKLRTELMDLIDFLEESIGKDPDEDMGAIAKAAVLRQELMDFLSRVTLFVGEFSETMDDMVGDWPDDSDQLDDRAIGELAQGYIDQLDAIRHRSDVASNQVFELIYFCISTLEDLKKDYLSIEQDIEQIILFLQREIEDKIVPEESIVQSIDFLEGLSYINGEYLQLVKRVLEFLLLVRGQDLGDESDSDEDGPQLA